MMNLLQTSGPWLWLALGGVLLILELLMPGVFLMWVGIAAMIVGLVGFTADLAWQYDVALFAVLTVLLVLVMRPRYAQLNSAKSDRPHLNQRMYDYVGKTFTLGRPIVDGRGQLEIEGTIWDVEGPDLPAGARVKVSGVDGMRLEVTAA